MLNGNWRARGSNGTFLKAEVGEKRGLLSFRRTKKRLTGSKKRQSENERARAKNSNLRGLWGDKIDTRTLAPGAVRSETELENHGSGRGSFRWEKVPLRGKSANNG